MLFFLENSFIFNLYECDFTLNKIRSTIIITSRNIKLFRYGKFFGKIPMDGKFNARLDQIRTKKHDKKLTISPKNTMKNVTKLTDFRQ